MARVYIGIGSNLNREYSLAFGLEFIEQLVGSLTRSAIYRSEAVGFNGPDFYNLVAGFNTTLELADLGLKLREIEYRCGRPQNAKKCSSRTLDIDILLYDRVVCESPYCLPRPEICFNAFVLRPLAEIAGEFIHPQTGLSLVQMWQQLAVDAIPLTRIDDSFLTNLSNFYDYNARHLSFPYSGAY
ncbi:2-amino-4-hydroxy-6-hydroxymethyldihydropteridine diphosphokinase [Celerinatantimonas diazotrophica]|uniref:2-amino-4-hydroxy-6-hydroxymethyldihydropteridine diphosphokinase n=1 Tax=Celerinatantimonas diazotrophica TaxID=412034 RepID=A0A4R1K242_9GAMM|nr:2-amino-4-hydroxy-6-hydroxymethyldihydropteridine diphosphokinase [Celerinatantimonas diazotrophica]TCK58088.1 2-amino-4-hydroxy-6-hydroxymethyldihydropteridine diphosphokinase [Celerinatantimonas diazotrophica]CAG9297840.1 2-amino-4-hydroxy-6-hydroxymethyldihydropteridinepyrophosphokinase [Celerinatantimonas diazotrophica]